MQAVATIATALAGAAAQLQRSLDTFETLDPAGEVAGAFRSSGECDELRDRISRNE